MICICLGNETSKRNCLVEQMVMSKFQGFAVSCDENGGQFIMIMQPGDCFMRVRHLSANQFLVEVCLNCQ